MSSGCTPASSNLRRYTGEFLYACAIDHLRRSSCNAVSSSRLAVSIRSNGSGAVMDVSFQLSVGDPNQFARALWFLEQLKNSSGSGSNQIALDLGRLAAKHGDGFLVTIRHADVVTTRSTSQRLFSRLGRQSIAAFDCPQE